jgi:hypothetical protein
MLNARISIKGTRPLLWHSFGPEALSLTKKEKTGVAGNDPEEWKRTVTQTPQGQLYLKSDQVFACLREGAKYTKKGRGSIQSLVAATLQVTDEPVLIDRFIPPKGGLSTDRDCAVHIDVRGVVNPTTKGRNVRYRVAASAGWVGVFTITFDETLVARDQMTSVVRDAGALVGIGNGRAIGMGRFELIEIVFTELKA